MTGEEVGALAYSGELMRPSPLPPTVRSVMRLPELAIRLPIPFRSGSRQGMGEADSRRIGGGLRSSTFRLSSRSDISFFVVVFDVVVVGMGGMVQRSGDRGGEEKA